MGGANDKSLIMALQHLVGPKDLTHYNGKCNKSPTNRMPNYQSEDGSLSLKV